VPTSDAYLLINGGHVRLRAKRYGGT